MLCNQFLDTPTSIVATMVIKSLIDYTKRRDNEGINFEFNGSTKYALFNGVSIFDPFFSILYHLISGENLMLKATQLFFSFIFIK